MHVWFISTPPPVGVDSVDSRSAQVMLAAISPALKNQEETLSTLRFASTVKRIKTKAKVNHDNKDAVRGLHSGLDCK